MHDYFEDEMTHNASRLYTFYPGRTLEGRTRIIRTAVGFLLFPFRCRKFGACHDSAKILRVPSDNAIRFRE